MIGEIDELLERYRKWLHEKTVVKNVGDWVEITTPYLDRHNDCIQIYAKKIDDSWLLSDDGYTIADLQASGLDVNNSEKRKELLRTTINGFGVKWGEGQELTVVASDAEFGFKKHNLVQAILGVGDLFYLNRATVTSVFFEEVKEWMDANDIRATANAHLIGKSGYDHRIDFIIPHSAKKPERLVRLINSPTKERAQSVMLSWVDVRDSRESGTIAYAFINDVARSVPDSVIEALTRYEIRPVRWSQRDSAREELAA